MKVITDSIRPYMQSFFHIDYPTLYILFHIHSFLLTCLLSHRFIMRKICSCQLFLMSFNMWELRYFYFSHTQIHRFTHITVLNEIVVSIQLMYWWPTEYQKSNKDNCKRILFPHEKEKMNLYSFPPWKLLKCNP